MYCKLTGITYKETNSYDYATTFKHSLANLKTVKELDLDKYKRGELATTHLAACVITLLRQYSCKSLRNVTPEHMPQFNEALQTLGGNFLYAIVTNLRKSDSMGLPASTANVYEFALNSFIDEPSVYVGQCKAWLWANVHSVNPSCGADSVTNSTSNYSTEQVERAAIQQSDNLVRLSRRNPTDFFKKVKSAITRSELSKEQQVMLKMLVDTEQPMPSNALAKVKELMLEHSQPRLYAALTAYNNVLEETTGDWMDNLLG